MGKLIGRRFRRSAGMMTRIERWMNLFAEGKDEPSLALGGQALIEGVMMRSRSNVVMCVRQPDNEILTHLEKIDSLSERYKILGLPFIRGIIALIETFYLGFKGIYFSADAVLGEEEKFTYQELVIVIVMALGLSSLFFVGPFLLTALLNPTGILFNFVEALVRLGIFLSYLAFVSLWSDFRRILQYHGAEHKTINAHEAGITLDLASVRKFPRFHPRCGSSFIFIVLIVSVLFFSIMPNLGFIARLSYRVLLIPVIGAVSYELLKLSGRYKESIITRILTLPGLALQRLTTREPDDDMLEVAVKALEEVRKPDRCQQTEEARLGGMCRGRSQGA